MVSKKNTRFCDINHRHFVQSLWKPQNLSRPVMFDRSESTARAITSRSIKEKKTYLYRSFHNICSFEFFKCFSITATTTTLSSRSMILSSSSTHRVVWWINKKENSVSLRRKVKKKNVAVSRLVRIFQNTHSHIFNTLDIQRTVDIE